MAGVYVVLAGVVVALHLAFVIFAAAGALLALRWPRVPWLHIPAAAWAASIEFSGGICPLTPIENALRAKAGLAYYSGDFIARYLFPVLYPAGLTREAQVASGLVVLAANVGLYIFVYTRRKRRFRDGRRRELC